MTTPDLLSTLLFVRRSRPLGSGYGSTGRRAVRIARARASLQILAFLLASAKDSVDGLREGLLEHGEALDDQVEDLIVELGALGDEIQEASNFASWMAERRDAPVPANEGGAEPREGGDA